MIGKLHVLATLALWQMRQAWRIFGLVALGMVAAVVLVGAVPLFALVNTTANVRAAFTSSGYDTSSIVQMPIVVPSYSDIIQAIQQLQQDYRQLGSPFFDLPPVVSLQVNTLGLEVHGFDTGRIASHVHILQGRLPQVTNDSVEVALTEDNAAVLGLHVGSTIRSQQHRRHVQFLADMG